MLSLTLFNISWTILWTRFFIYIIPQEADNLFFLFLNINKY